MPTAIKKVPCCILYGRVSAAAAAPAFFCVYIRTPDLLLLLRRSFLRACHNFFFFFLFFGKVQVERRVSFFIYYWTSLNNITGGREAAKDLYMCPTFLGRELYILTLSRDLHYWAFYHVNLFTKHNVFFFYLFLCCVMTGFFVTFIITRIFVSPSLSAICRTTGSFFFLFLSGI